MTTGSTRLVSGPRAAVLRRELGPLAWCALEFMVEQSSDGVTTEASVRTLAAALGVAKNAAHRAVVALTRAGFIEGIQDRGTDGRFRPGRYRLLLTEDLLTRTSQPRRSQHRNPPTAAAAAQLTLLTPA
jgi:DNA-binding IclR family transcriptional regulator